ncbi:MAG: DUF2062 domain-containing protein [Bacteroidota bacterium]|nr:MAG: DUF2062 domain-containing protein [Bacteroidota bacterium]
MMRLLKRKVLLPIRKALKNGLSHRKLALSLALGITIGLMPFYGITTILVGILAYAMKLDFVITQAVHYLVHPLQIALFVPFFKLGNYLVGSGTSNYSFSEVMLLFRENFWMALVELWKLNMLAIAIWGLLAIPIFYGLYRLFIFSIGRYAVLLVRKPLGIKR